MRRRSAALGSATLGSSSITVPRSAQATKRAASSATAPRGSRHSASRGSSNARAAWLVMERFAMGSMTLTMGAMMRTGAPPDP